MIICYSAPASTLATIDAKENERVDISCLATGSKSNEISFGDITVGCRFNLNATALGGRRCKMEGEELTLLLVRVIMSGISLVACLLMLATLCGFRKYLFLP
jgi:hypothetical protein